MSELKSNPTNTEINSGIMQEPITPAFTDRIEDDTPEVPKKRLGKGKVALGTVAVLAFSAASVTGALLFKGFSEEGHNSGTPDSDTKDRQTAETQAPVTTTTPEATATPSPEALSSNEIAPIPAGLSTDEYGNAVINAMSTWVMMGTGSDKFSKEWLFGSKQENVALLQTTAEKDADKVTKALFVSNWEDNTSLQTFRAKFLQYNRASIDMWLNTYKSGHNEDKAPYNANYTVDSVEQVSSDSTSRTIEIDGTQHNNSDLNRLSDPSSSLFSSNEVNFNGMNFTYVFTTKIENGEERIASWQIVNN